MKQRLRTKAKENLDNFTNPNHSVVTHSYNYPIKKVVYPALLFILSLHFINGQSAGDLAFIGWNSDGNDDVVFILMADFSASTIVYIMG